MTYSANITLQRGYSKFFKLKKFADFGFCSRLSSANWLDSSSMHTFKTDGVVERL